MKVWQRNFQDHSNNLWGTLFEYDLEIYFLCGMLIFNVTITNLNFLVQLKPWWIFSMWNVSCHGYNDLLWRCSWHFFVVKHDFDVSFTFWNIFSPLLFTPEIIIIWYGCHSVSIYVISQINTCSYFYNAESLLLIDSKICQPSTTNWLIMPLITLRR